MHITIHDLSIEELDKFICQDTDIYAHSIQNPSAPGLVDLRIAIQTIAVDDSHIILEFPNDAVLVVEILNDSYTSIEVF